MATQFGEWIRDRRTQLGMTQAELAKRIQRELGSEYTRDRMWLLEKRGQPDIPPPELVQAVAHALGRPITEALHVLGYDVPTDSSAIDRLHPDLVNAVEDLPLPVQQHLAGLIPALVRMAGDIQRRQTLRVAEPKGKYTPANSET